MLWLAIFMSHEIHTSTPILSALETRFSTRAYDTEYQLSKDELTAVLEAARWAPSGNNGQPWRYSVLQRGTELHTKVSEGLSGFNRSWAPMASNLIVVSTQKFKADGSAYGSAKFDAGLSVGHLIAQASSMGLATRIMGGINHTAIHETLGLEDSLEVLVVIALGKPAASLDGLEQGLVEREHAPRERHSLDEIVLHGRP